MPLDRPFLTAMSVFALVALTLLPATPAEAHEPISHGVSMDGYHAMEVSDPDIALGFRQWDRLHVELWVLSGGPVDVYMMKSSEFHRYEDGGSFKVALKKENVNHTKFTFENPDDSTWFLVVDNMDNPRSGDAIPTGEVEYEYVGDIEERHQEMELQQIYTAACVVAALIIIVAVVFVRKKLKG